MTASAAADYTWPVVRVIDGDTAAMNAPADPPPELADFKVAAERAAGRAATAFTRAAIAGAGVIAIQDPEWEKWGGRVIADLIVDGRSLSAALTAAGHGRIYGGGKRAGWCG